jgi:C4-dicarboxylate-specific signal transduction histidine kinase
MLLEKKGLGPSFEASPFLPVSDIPLQNTGYFSTPPWGRQVLLEALIALWIPLIVLSAVQLLRLSAGTIEALAYNQWTSYRVTGAVLFLLATEALLVAIVFIQIRRGAKLQGELRESQDQLQLCGRAMNIGLWMWTARNRMLSMDENCAALLLCPQTAPLGFNSMVEAAYPDDHTVVERAIQNAVEARTGFEVEFRLRSFVEQANWVLVRGYPEVDPEGELVRLKGVTVDVTERKTMQQEIEQQRRSLAHMTRVNILGKFSAALAHELNQPLAAIMSNAQAAQRMIRSTHIDVSELQQTIADIIEDDTRAGDVIRHLRRLLKDKPGGFELIDLNEPLLSALELARGDFNARHISVVSRPSPNPMLVQGDTVQLQQVVLNLLINGAESIATSGQREGVLEVFSDITPKGSAHISISDNGSGIKPEAFGHLFEPFFSTKDQGMGLGLSICNGIISRHNGQIWATNNPDRGATFHFAIPLAFVS